MLSLKQFQTDAIHSAVLYFKNTLSLLNNSHLNNAEIINKAGYCLIEAPTGAGKTLIAGHIAEKISKEEKIIWFWFTPFAGLVEQAARTIKSEFNTLNIKNLYFGRQAEDLSKGNIFITTWASVASAKKENRLLRKSTETEVSLDQLITMAKSIGFHIGVIIDESHHSFKKNTEAQRFYTSVLNPSITLLITATPKDKDIETFKQTVGISHIEKLSVSRTDCVNAHLIKKGIKATAFITDKWTSSLIDLKKTALAQGTEIHNKIKSTLDRNNFPVVPLMLVQVDSTQNSIEDAKKHLFDLGFTNEQIAVHTSDEPDPNLIALAHDESKEVLIFKMAVALGFDAPRAFTLVSLRSSRDIGFGIQIVGRILRIDRRLQGKELPDFLQYGYVVMLDEDTQTGLSLAADRINTIKTELSTASPNVNLIDMIPSAEDTNNDLSFEKKQNVLQMQLTKYTQDVMNNYFSDTSASDIYSDSATPVPQSKSNITANSSLLQEEFKYPLNASLNSPLTLYKEIYSLNQRDIIPCISRQINFDDSILSLFLKDSTAVIKKEVDIFEHSEFIETGTASLSRDKIMLKAQQIIFNKEYIDGKALYEALYKRMKSEIFTKGWTSQRDASFIDYGLSLAIALHPELLDDAIKKCTAAFIELRKVFLPTVMHSYTQLQNSRLNVYGRYPQDLNRWELEFAKLLDHDTSGTVLWWHRNPVRKESSVTIVDPNLKYDFYPDFIVGVKNRDFANDILLVEIKGAINRDQNELYKSRATHQVYKNVMMLFWDNEREWHTVKYDSKSGRNILDQVFRIDLMADY